MSDESTREAAPLSAAAGEALRLRDATDRESHLDPLRVPHSSFASEVAKRTFESEVGPATPPPGADVLTLRRHYAAFNDRLLERALARYAVDIGDDDLGGVRVHRVRPHAPSMQQPARILINLHGGGFLWGAGSGALVEAVPMAATMGVEVVTVDYRMAPEHVFPAASEDVAQVYRALLHRYDAKAIGVFGCSAGALLTAQTVARMIHEQLPMPGAIAMLCGGGIEFGGDSAWTAPMLTGEPRSSVASSSDGGWPRFSSLPYLAGTDPTDPLVFPAVSAAALARFPPSLLLTASRDFAASSVTMLHRQLLAAGVDARLVMFDGLWHAFQVFAELPEAREAHRLMAEFFDRTLSGGLQHSTTETRK